MRREYDPLEACFSGHVLQTPSGLTRNRRSFLKKTAITALAAGVFILLKLCLIWLGT